MARWVLFPFFSFVERNEEIWREYRRSLEDKDGVVGGYFQCASWLNLLLRFASNGWDGQRRLIWRILGETTLPRVIYTSSVELIDIYACLWAKECAWRLEPISRPCFVDSRCNIRIPSTFPGREREASWYFVRSPRICRVTSANRLGRSSSTIIVIIVAKRASDTRSLLRSSCCFFHPFFLY